MSSAEHLIENAIICIENDRDMAFFIDDEKNKEMAEDANIPLEAVWEMAQFVKYKFEPFVRSCVRMQEQERMKNNE